MGPLMYGILGAATAIKIALWIYCVALQVCFVLLAMLACYIHGCLHHGGMLVTACAAYGMGVAL